jgi:hypothetical protein
MSLLALPDEIIAHVLSLGIDPTIFPCLESMCRTFRRVIRITKTATELNTPAWLKRYLLCKTEPVKLEISSAEIPRLGNVTNERYHMQSIKIIWARDTPDDG